MFGAVAPCYDLLNHLLSLNIDRYWRRQATRLVPPHELFGRLYRFYFRRGLPLIGQLVSRSPDSAYRYLPASVLAFPDGEALAERLRRHGLTEVHWRPFTFGIATLYVGTKP